MKTAKEKLAAYAAAQTTEMLMDAARKNNSNTTPEGIIASNAIESELERRLSDADFAAFMDELYAAL